MLVFVKERHPLSWADLCAVAANQYDVKIKWQSSTSRHIDFAPDTQNRKQDVTLFIIPAEHDADPQSIILNRFSFIEGIVSEAIELAGPQDGAEDRMRAFFHAHWEELDSTLDALISMLRRQAIPLGPPDGNSSNSKPTPGATNTSSKDVATLPPDTRVDGIIGRLGSVSTTVETTDDEPEIIPHHGSAENPITSISWITASRLREAERAAGRQMGMQTTATTIDDYEEGDCKMQSHDPSSPNKHQPANTMDTLYTPTDPNLTGSQALPFLQNCIDRVAQVAVLTGNSEEAIRRHLSEHTLYFNAVLHVLDQAFHLPVTFPPPAVGTDNTSGTTLTATHAPEPDYFTTHDPSLGYYNPYLTMDPQNQGSHFDYPAIPHGETSGTTLDADQDAMYDAGSHGTQTQGRY
ncbi:hypothetical protein MBLNU13_g03862t1 [Cladosporium sp. NU13]